MISFLKPNWFHLAFSLIVAWILLDKPPKVVSTTYETVDFHKSFFTGNLLSAHSSGNAVELIFSEGSFSSATNSTDTFKLKVGEEFDNFYIPEGVATYSVLDISSEVIKIRYSCVFTTAGRYRDKVELDEGDFEIQLAGAN